MRGIRTTPPNLPAGRWIVIEQRDTSAALGRRNRSGNARRASADHSDVEAALGDVIHER
jgi:hypothetical protein